MKAHNDLDYLYASGRIRALEGKMLSPVMKERILEAPSIETAFSLLRECGYRTPQTCNSETLEQILQSERFRTYEMVNAMIPDPRIVDIFRVRYDYHNVKVYIKNSVRDEQMSSLLSVCGRIPVNRLIRGLQELDYRDFPPTMRNCIPGAREAFARSGDPQQLEITLDRGAMADMLSLAESTADPFLIGLVRLMIDSANLQGLIRSKRMGKDLHFFKGLMARGGNVTPQQLSEAYADLDLQRLYSRSLLLDTALSGIKTLTEGASITLLESLSAKAITAYLAPARWQAYGSSLAIAFLVEKEMEIDALRLLLTGRLMGLSAEKINERMSSLYV